LNEQEILAPGRLGWPLRRIEKETGVRRETIAGYLKTEDIAVRPSRGRGKKPAPPDPKPANGVTTDFDEKPASLALDPTSNRPKR